MDCKKIILILIGVIIIESVGVTAYVLGTKKSLGLFSLSPAVEVKPSPETMQKDTVTSRSAVEKLLQELDWNLEEALRVSKRVRGSTVCLIPSKKGLEGGGCSATGSVVRGGLIATCGHCAHGHDEKGETTHLFVRTSEGKVFSAEVAEVHATEDVGILRITSNVGQLPPPLEMGYASVGDPVIAVGHPGGVGTWVITLGKITDVIPVKEVPGDIKYTATLPTRGGSSGSPAVNSRGELIGVISGSTYVDKPDPDPSEIVLNFEDVSESVATIESRGVLADLIERHQQ